MTKTYLFLLLLFPALCSAQFAITGKIRTQDSNTPVPDASVYLAGATVGGKSSDNGIFLLKNVRPGKYDLVVSVVGYESFHENIQVSKGDITLSDILLSPQIKVLQEVTIKVDKNRERNLEWFKDEFVGTSDLAKQCEIVNPEVLNLDYDEKAGVLTASSDDYLIIKNNALGYQVEYLLADFTLNNKQLTAKTINYHGSIFFREMNGTPAQDLQWKKNREEVYSNSLPHFLRAALTNRMEEEGFQAYRIAILPNPQRPAENIINKEISFYQDSKNQAPGWKDSLSYWKRKAKLPYATQKFVPIPLTRDDIISGTAQAGIYSLACEFDELYVSYSKYHHFVVGHNFNTPATGATLINFKAASVLFDDNGGLIDPNSLELTGEWTGRRVAETLPIDYEPDGSKVDYTVSRKLGEKIKDFARDHPIEKVYLHFDRPFYAVADTIYFRAYVTENDMKLSSLSGLLHADLISPDNKVFQSLNLRLINGMASRFFCASSGSAVK